MLFLLDRGVKTVKWNGIPLHEVSSAVVKEELNGDFVLTMTYPITDSGVYQLIKEDMLIKAPTPVLGEQLFRIKKPVEQDDRLDITAYHISDDIMQRSIRPMSVVGQACGVVLSQMIEQAKAEIADFSFASDIMSKHTFNTTEDKTLYSILLEGKHSIVGTWEGELVRDNFTLSVSPNRGADRGVIITTHKSLKSYQRTKNSQEVVTRIYAKSSFREEGAEEDTVLRVVVDSPLIGDYPYIHEREYENNTAKTVDDLRKWAEAKFKHEGIDKVGDRLEIEAYELDGQEVHLGDTVAIKSRKHQIDVCKKAIAYEYNPLTKRYVSLTFDDQPGLGGSGLTGGVAAAAGAILDQSVMEQEVVIERAIQNANRHFEANFEKKKVALEEEIERSRAKAEVYADRVRQELGTQFSDAERRYQASQSQQAEQLGQVLRQAGASQVLAEEAKRLGQSAQADVREALSRARQAKEEAVAETQRLVTTERQETERRLALAKSQVITEATRLVEGARSQLTGQLSRAEDALERVKTALETQVSGVTMEVTQTKESLKTLATKSDLDKTKQRVSIAETSLTQQAGQIALKANQETVDTLTRRVKTAETSIRQQADQIELKASRSDVAGLANRVSGAEASLRVQVNQIALKASQSALDGLTGRVSSAESSLLVQANQISQLVRSSDFDPVRQRLTRAESSITQLGSRITTEIEQVTSKVDRLKLGSRNYAEDYSFTRGLWEYSQGDNSRANWQVADGVYTVTGTTDTWKQYQIYSESGSRRGGKSDSTALLELVEGETYTLSVEAKVVSGSPEFWLELRDNGLRQYDAVVTHLFGVKQASSQWVRYTVTGVIKPNTDFSHRRIILGYSKVGTMAFRKVELTKSSQAMDAGPALEDLGADLERVKTTITQTAEGVSQVSSRLSETAGRVTQTETQIRHLVGEVSSKVAQRDYDRLAGKVSSNSTAIGQTSAALELKADKTVTDSLQGTVNQTKAELTILDNAVKTKVAQTDFDNAKVRLSTAESSIQTMAGQIETKLSRVDATKIVTNRIEQSERGMTARISQLEGKIPLETSGNLLVASGDGWRNLHQKDFVISEPMYAGSTYTVTVRWWREDGSRLNFGIRRNGNDSWQWVDLEYNRQIDAWTKTFTLTKSLNAGDRVSFFTVEQNGRGSGAWATLTKGTTPLSVWEPSYKELVTETKFHEVKDTVDSHTRTIAEQGQSISQVVQTANGLVTRVENLSVGGRNWVRGSSQMRKGSGTWESGTFRHSGSGRSEQMTILDFPGNELVSGIRLVGQGAGIAQDACFVTEGPWTMSYWVNGQKGTQVRLQAYWSSSNSQTGVSPTVTLKGGWERLSFSAYNREAGRCSIAYLYLVTGQEVVVARPQLENGALLTDYRPAPEDGEKELTATKTEVSQLAGSYAIRNLTSAGDLISGLNLGANGHNRLDGRLTHITGQTLIDNAVIKSAMVDKLKTANFEAGTISGVILTANSITGNHIVADEALFNKLAANEAQLRKLFAREAFISQVQAVTLSASQISGGELASLNGAMRLDLNNGALNFFTENPAMRRAVPGYGNQFIKFATGHFNQTGQWQDSFESNQTIIGSNRNGIESVEDGGFAGFRIWNMRVNNGRQADMADMIDVIGDRIVFQDAATGSTRSPWILETYSGSHDLRFYPRNDNGRRHHLGTEGNKFKTIHGEDIYANQIIIGGERLAMMLKDLANKIGYSGVNGWADRMR